MPAKASVEVPHERRHHHRPVVVHCLVLLPRGEVRVSAPSMLAEALRLMRVYHDMNQTELSREIGMSTATISMLEKGTREPSLETLQKYAQAFKVPVSSILFFSEELSGEGITKPIRKTIAKKIVAILAWIAERSEES
jgi:transcriptional regulator with XRE-family HTH domain